MNPADARGFRLVNLRSVQQSNRDSTTGRHLVYQYGRALGNSAASDGLECV